MARVPQTAYFYDLYAKADLALSMRVHSMSPAMGLGTPTVALASQSRMTAFLKDAELEDFCIDIFDDDFHTKLAAKIIGILRDSEETRNRLKKAVAVLRDRTRRFHLETLRPFLAAFK
jgi:polysaccharide pyruvyl transferase WcaK-like protein